MTRLGVHYEFVLPAEPFALSAGKITFPANDEDPSDLQASRLDGMRTLVETLDLIYGNFCERRLSKAWEDDVKKIRSWLNRGAVKEKRPAAYARPKPILRLALHNRPGLATITISPPMMKFSSPPILARC